MSAIGGKADMPSASHNVRLWPKADTRLLRNRRLVVCHFSLAAGSQSARLWLLHKGVVLTKGTGER